MNYHIDSDYWVKKWIYLMSTDIFFSPSVMILFTEIQHINIKK